MPTTESIEVRKLNLDLHNFRTVPQADEISAVQAMISVSPNNFWALMTSLLEDGYHPTENIIVLRNGTKLTVREGNRRVAALKLVHGLLPSDEIDIPENILNDIKNAASAWKKSNKSVPCAIYEEDEADVVDKIVTLIHGKGEKARRESWEAVARARHNRDINGRPEPGLDMFEKYLKRATNITEDQKRRWAGDYPITVLDESIKKFAKRMNLRSAAELASTYPTVKYRSKLDQIMRDIGTHSLTFKKIRAEEPDFLAEYGLPEIKEDSGKEPKPSPTADKSNGDSGANASAAKNRKTRAVSTHDPRAVKRALRELNPSGNFRGKIVLLRDEALRLNLTDNPIAFCFLLRALFEISAKAYCREHKSSGGPSAHDKNGNEKVLSVLLKDVARHIVANSEDPEMKKQLHGAEVELGKKEGVLSVTSMNQLAHNTVFTVVATDIAALFGNVFPLLQEMNQ